MKTTVLAVLLLALTNANSGCGQSDTKRGWWCTTIEVDGKQTPWCANSAESCNPSNPGSCTHLAQVWCPAPITETSETLGVCTYSEESCKETWEKPCMPRE